MSGKDAMEARETRERRSRAGFSLIEVLIGTAILTIVAVGILPLFASSIRSNREGNDSTQVSNFARERLEEFFELPFNSSRLTLTSGDENLFQEYYSLSDAEWKDGLPPTDDTDPALWTRETQVRQYSVRALEDGELEVGEALAAGAPASEIHLKEVEVTVASTARSGLLGPGKQITLRTLKAQ